VAHAPKHRKLLAASPIFGTTGVRTVHDAWREWMVGLEGRLPAPEAMAAVRASETLQLGRRNTEMLHKRRFPCERIQADVGGGCNVGLALAQYEAARAALGLTLDQLGGGCRLLRSHRLSVSARWAPCGRAGSARLFSGAAGGKGRRHDPRNYACGC
jgi:hypothetical protein